MSIQAILGVPGAGKSYEAVQRAKGAVENGRVVITNLPLKKSHPFWAKAVEDNLLFLVPSTKHAAPTDKNHFGHIDAWADIIDGAPTYQRENSDSKSGEASKQGPLVLVDEAMITFQAFLREKRKNESWSTLLVFFAAHRHMFIDIYVMFHDHGQVDPSLKQVIERWHHVKNTSEMTGMNTFMIGSSLKGFVNGNNYIDKHNGKFKSAIFDMYDSYAEGTGAGATGKKSENGVRRSKPIWQRWWAILTVGLTVLILPFAAYKTAKGIKGAISADEPQSLNVGAVSAGSRQEVLSVEQRAALLAGQNTVPKNPTTASLQWPDPSVPFLGFDNENVYFPDGVRLNLFSQIQPQGFKIIEINLCRVTLVRTTEARVELIEYTCAKGY